MKTTPENFNWNEINSQPNSEESNIDSTTAEANDITPNDYDITTSFLPRKNEPEPVGINYLNDTDYINYTDL